MAKNLPQPTKKSAVSARYDARELARLFDMSPRQLQRKFNRYMKRSPQDWLNEQRVMAARRLLLTGGSVKEVAFELGFKQVSHFCRQFKMYHHMTPSEFVKAKLNRRA
jgi:AraC family cel operon transcriptional repressor